MTSGLETSSAYISFCKTPDPMSRAERMWVEITERAGARKWTAYRGVLTNQPGYIRDLRQGDVIDFRPPHVARILLSPSHPDWLEIGEKTALVSARVLEPGHRVRWAYREHPDQREDSGWRLFAGDESPEYSEDAANIRMCNVYWLADRDPTLIGIFKAEVGAAFERPEGVDEWTAIEDWKPAEH